MRRSSALLVAVGGAVVVVGACTIFDGLDNRVVGADAGDAAPDVAPDSALPPNTQAGYLSVADGVGFCSNAFACPNLTQSTEFSIDVPVDSNHFSSCVDWVSGPLPKDRNGHDATAAVLECAAKASSCTAAGACMWQEVIGSGDPRCAGKDAGPLGVCGDSNASVYLCGYPAILHCGNAYYASGSTCLYDDAGSAYCARLPCGAQQCLGDMLTFCGVDGLAFSENCAIGGFTCGFDTSEGFDDCLTNGAAKNCSSLAVTCSGSTVQICDGALVSNYDCGAYGGTCDTTGFPRCKRPDETCTPNDGDVDVCSGTNITLCVGGTKQTFDCASIGKTCADASGGQSGHCQ